MRDALNWSSDSNFTIGGVSFISTVNPAIYHTLKSSEDNFLLIKSREMIETELKRYIDGVPVRNVVDIGIWQGGSVALLDLTLNPQRLLAIEYNPAPIPALDTYVEKRHRNNISVHYGINQGATDDVVKILDETFGDDPIDLVIDDASHQYIETKKSFEAIFPRMAPHSQFIIEDWQWSLSGNTWELDYFRDKPSLANLVVEIAAVVGSRRDLISEVTILPFCTIVKRGTAPYSKVPLKLDEIARSRGKSIEPVL